MSAVLDDLGPDLVFCRRFQCRQDRPLPFQRDGLVVPTQQVVQGDGLVCRIARPIGDRRRGHGLQHGDPRADVVLGAVVEVDIPWFWRGERGRHLGEVHRRAVQGVLHRRARGEDEG